MQALGTLLRFELLQLVRDRRTVLVAVVAPLLLFPGMLVVNRLTGEADATRRLDTVYRYAVTGSDSAATAALVERARELPPDTSDEDAVAESEAGGLQLARVLTGAPDSLLAAGGLQLVVENTGPDSTGVPVLELRYRASSDLSRTAANRVSERLRRLRSLRRDSLFRASGLPVDRDQVLPLSSENVASAQREAGSFLGLVLPPVIVMLMLTGGSIVAADTLSGEKERGTLETLLTTAVSRREIVGAKALAIVLVGLVVTLINVLNLGVYVGLGLVDVPEGMAASVTGPSLLALLLLLLPVAALIAAVLLLTSGLARSYREYQLYFPVVFLVMLVPSAAGALPGLDLRSAVILVPVANIALALREVLAGRPDVLFGGLAALITGGAALWIGLMAEHTMSTERLLADTQADRAELVGGASLFPYRVLRWFGLLWVAFLAVSVWFGADLGVRGQILVNILGLFLGSALLMIRWYRLPLRQALALRPVHPLVWPAVLVGAPCALLTGIGLANLTGRFIPVPDRVMEAFGQFVTPDGVGTVQLVLLLAVLPGICEEIAFRGILLYGLRRRLGPVTLALAVGGIFGLFHVSLFRIVPTAYLGTILATVVILTGSIFPAMLWHALNNAVALLPASAGWAQAPIPPWAYVLAAGGLVLSLVVLRRVGSGYPGVTRAE